MAISDMLSSIDPTTMLLGLLFIIFYILIKFSLSKIFKNDKSSPTIISLCVSLLAVYGINRSNFNISGLFSNIGISEEIIYAVVPWIIIGLSILASFAKYPATGKRKFRLYRLFMILGAFLILLSFFAYEQGILMIIGAILILIGLFLWWRNKKKGTSSPPPGTTNGSAALEAAAKKFNTWAKGQSNPRFVGSWANFINYLKRGGWGNNEAEICQRLRISQSEFVNIFNKYGLVK
jgi:hypothetical protein